MCRVTNYYTVFAVLMLLLCAPRYTFGQAFIDCQLLSDDLMSREEVAEALEMNAFIAELDSFQMHHKSLYCSALLYGNLEAQAHALNQLAAYHYCRSDYSIATELLLQGYNLSVTSGFKHGLVDYECYMGLIRQDLGHTEKAVAHFRNLLKYGEEFKNDRWVADAYINIGSICISTGNLAEAKEYLEKSRVLLKDQEVTESIGWVYSHLGNVAVLEGDTVLALNHLNKAKDLWTENNAIRGLAYVYGTLGEIIKVDDPALAINYHQQALKYAIESEFKSQEQEAKQRIGNIYSTIDRDSSEHYLTASLNSMTSESSLVLKESASDDLLFLYKNSGDKEGYLKHLEKHYHIVKELLAYQKSEHSNWIRLEGEMQNKQREIYEQQLQAEQSSSNYKNVLIGLLLLAVLSLLLCWYMFKHLQLSRELSSANERLKESVQLLETQSEDLESQNKELDDQKNTLASQLANRLAMVREVHLQKDRLTELIHELKIDTSCRSQLLKVLDQDSNTELLQNLDQELAIVHSSLFSKLVLKHPTLTANNLKLISYVKMHLTNKEIADLLYISADSVKVAKNRLKKKLELNADVSLDFYIHSLSAE